jgi:hypothetical protein
MDDVLPPRAGTDDATIPPVAWADPGAPSVPLPEPVILDVGDVLGRVVHTYLAGWRVFLAMAAPSAVLAAVTSAVAAVTFLSGVVAPAIAFLVFTLLVSVISNIAMILATADMRAGATPSVASSFQRAARRLLPALGSVAAIFAVVIGILFVVFAIGAFLRMRPTSGSGLAGFVVIVASIVLVVITIRWILAPAAVAIDRAGPIAALTFSRNRSRRNAWRLLGLLVAIGLLSAPLTIGASLISRYADPLPTAIGLFIAALVTGPFLAISLATAYGDLSGHPIAEAVERPAGRSRNALVGSFVGVAAIVFTFGIVLASQGGGHQLLVPDPGVILAGTGQNSLNRCRPESIKSTFETGEPIYIGGYFSRSADPNEDLTIAVYVDDVLIIRDVLASRPDGISCYYEPEPIRDAPPGGYRIQILNGAETVADGRFTVR